MSRSFSERNIFVPYMRECGIETTKELARMVGVGQVYMSAYATGRAIPRLYMALDIAQVLHTTVEELWGHLAAEKWRVEPTNEGADTDV